MQLENQTDWAAGLYPGWSRQGHRQWTLVFKASYQFDGQGTLTALPQVPIVEADQYRGEPTYSSLVASSEVAPFKQGAELYLFGSAQPDPYGSRVIQVALSLCQNNNRYWHKELRVFGNRSWQRRMLTPLPGKPASITAPVPLIYENAFGGSDPAHPEQVCLANPAGVGYSFRGLRTKNLGLPAIEIGPNFISSPASRVQPAGFGPLPPFWDPRCREVGEIDAESVAQGLCPWAVPLPATMHNVAPQDQRFDAPFQGEMVLKITGLLAAASHEVLIRLPELKPAVFRHAGEQLSRLDPVCDTLVIDTDRQEIHQIFRCGVVLDLHEKEFGLLILRNLLSEKNPVAAEALT